MNTNAESMVSENMKVLLSSARTTCNGNASSNGQGHRPQRGVPSDSSRIFGNDR